MWQSPQLTRIPWATFPDPLRGPAVQLRSVWRLLHQPCHIQQVRVTLAGEWARILTLKISVKLPEVLSTDRLPAPQSQGPSSADGKDIAFHPPVYPAAILLVCNNCVAYRKLLEAQAPGMQKWVLQQQNKPLKTQLQRLERERMAKKSRRDNETPEEREVRRMRDREAKRLQRMQETDEQRARRLQRDREAMRLKRANETPEKRQARLIREREAKKLKRHLEKMDMMLQAQFGQDPSAMAALAAEMDLFRLPVSSVELESQLLGKMTFEEQSNSALH